MGNTMRDKIELSKLEQEIYEKYTHIRPSHKDDEYRFGTLFMDAGPQHFQVLSCDFESDRQADWFRRLLAKALAHIVLECTDGGKHD